MGSVRRAAPVHFDAPCSFSRLRRIRFRRRALPFRRDDDLAARRRAGGVTGARLRLAHRGPWPNCGRHGSTSTRTGAAACPNSLPRSGHLSRKTGRRVAAGRSRGHHAGIGEQTAQVEPAAPVWPSQHEPPRRTWVPEFHSRTRQDEILRYFERDGLSVTILSTYCARCRLTAWQRRQAAPRTTGRATGPSRIKTTGGSERHGCFA